MLVRKALFVCVAFSATAFAQTGTFRSIDLSSYTDSLRINWGYPTGPYSNQKAGLSFAGSTRLTSFYSGPYNYPAPGTGQSGRMSFGNTASAPYWLFMTKDTINLGDSTLANNTNVYGTETVHGTLKVTGPSSFRTTVNLYNAYPNDTLLTWGIPQVYQSPVNALSGLSWGLKNGNKFNAARNNALSSTTSFYTGNYNYPAAGTPYPGRMTFGLTATGPYWLTMEQDSIRIGDSALATNARVYGNLSVTGKASIAGNTSIGGALTVALNESITKGLYVGDSLALGVAVPTR